MRSDMIFQQIFLNSLITASVYGLLAVGFNLNYGTVRFFDLSYAAVPVIGAYTALYASKILGLPLGVGILFGILFSGLFSLGVYRLVYIPLQNRKASKMIFLVASLGIFTVCTAVIPMLFSSQFQTLSTLISQTTVKLGAVVLTPVHIVTVIAFIVVSVCIAVFLKRTRMGKAVRAIGDDEEITKTMGVNTRSIVSRVFLISGAIGGLAGVLVGLDTGMDPNMGFALLLKAVIACIIGGVGNVYAGVVGALILSGIENIGSWYFSSAWKDLIAFSVLILFLVVRPNGIWKK